jgi:phosphoribosylpyrophosphate synthetase
MSNAAGGSALGLVFLLHPGGGCPLSVCPVLWFACREPYTALRQMPAKTAAVATSGGGQRLRIAIEYAGASVQIRATTRNGKCAGPAAGTGSHQRTQNNTWQKPDMLISVPLYRHRQWRRGYNQSDLLCRALPTGLCCRYEPSAIVRIRATSIQHHLSARLRKRNLKNAFRLELPVQGLHMVIVDDVVTTGSTVAEISRLLLRNGAASVQVWCLCRTL